MAHHGSAPLNDSELAKLFGQRSPELDVEQALGKLGATGKFPEGKLTDRDEGEIRIAIGQRDGKIVIDFGQPTAWIGFTADQADDLANVLHKHATEARRGEARPT